MQRRVIVDALRRQDFSRAVLFDLDLPAEPYVAGAPDTRAVRASLYVWPLPILRPSSIGVDVLRIDQTVLDTPISFEFPLTADEMPRAAPLPERASDRELAAAADDDRPLVIRYPHAEWRLVRPGRTRQAFGLDARGAPVYQDVDTSIYCYRLICARCGRRRYAKRNNLHEIEYCWICTKQLRLRNRALLHYRQHQRQNARRLTPVEVAKVCELSARRIAQAEIARQLNVTEGAVSRVLARRRKT